MKRNTPTWVFLIPALIFVAAVIGLAVWAFSANTQIDSSIMKDVAKGPRQQEPEEAIADIPDVIAERAPEPPADSRVEIPEDVLIDIAKLIEDEPVDESSRNRLTAVVTTNKGTFTIGFFDDTAPKHVENFLKLVREGFYNGLTFHRYVAGFVIQGGDPEGTGSSGPGYLLQPEFSDKHKHVKGAVAMARKGDQVNPGKESNGSQFYICLAPQPSLDGEYTVWGEVIDGMDIVMSLRQGDKMVKIEIVSK